jgi:hypothetical protein
VRPARGIFKFPKINCTLMIFMEYPAAETRNANKIDERASRLQPGDGPGSYWTFEEFRAHSSKTRRRHAGLTLTDGSARLRMSSLEGSPPSCLDKAAPIRFFSRERHSRIRFVRVRDPVSKVIARLCDGSAREQHAVNRISESDVVSRMQASSKIASCSRFTRGRSGAAESGSLISGASGDDLPLPR